MNQYANSDFGLGSAQPQQQYRRLFGIAARAVVLTLWAGISIPALAQSAGPGGIESLESFVKNTRSGRASFTQTVTAPAKDGQTARSKNSSGQFEFLRPNRFKFVYQKPFEQSIVSDGQTLWL